MKEMIIARKETLFEVSLFFCLAYWSWEKDGLDAAKVVSNLPVKCRLPQK